MSFDTMLNHKCDVYHIIKSDASPSYGLPPSPSFSYSATPDIVDVACHFGVANGATVGVKVMQNAPMAAFDGRVKLALPIGVDIRLSDKIVNKETGYEYTAEAPTKIRDHHIVVMLRQTKSQGYING